jgi:hypothetical protein
MGSRTEYNCCVHNDQVVVTRGVEDDNYTELSPSGGTINSADIQELPSILWNPKVHYSVHKNQTKPDQSNPHHPILSL